MVTSLKTLTSLKRAVRLTKMESELQHAVSSVCARDMQRQPHPTLLEEGMEQLVSTQ